MPESFWSCLAPNRINIILAISGYGIWYAYGTLAYGPLNEFFLSSTVDGSYPYALTLIRFIFDFLSFFIIGSFALWLVHNLEE